jgi:CheY-like chemotaxis protein
MHTLSVLLVEDSDFLAQQIEDGITGTRIDVTRVGTASEAEDVVSEQPIDCVLTNHGLPDTTGIALADNLPATVPVVLLTATALDEVSEDALEAGVTEFYRKDALSDMESGNFDILQNRIRVAFAASQWKQTRT